MGVTLKKTRGVAADVGRYSKQNTGTLGNPKSFGKPAAVQRGDPQFISSRLTDTRQDARSTSAQHHDQVGAGDQPSGKSARVLKDNATRPTTGKAVKAPGKSSDSGM